MVSKSTRSLGNLFLYLLLFSFSSMIYSQEVKIGKTYKFIVEVPARLSAFPNGNYESDTRQDIKVLERGVLFRVIDKRNDSILVRALIKNDGTGNKESVFDNGFEKNKYYLVKADNIDNRIVEPSSLINVGLLTVPFKARFSVSDSPFAFSPEFNIASSFGYRVFQNWNYSQKFYLQGGVGITTVGLNSSNSSIENPQNVSALTLMLGAMIDYRGIQIGLYMGWDSINNNEEYLWDYQGRSWLSLGIGFGLFKFGGKDNKD